MSSLVTTLIAILPITVFGALLSNLYIEEDSKMEKITLGYILGLGIYTFILFLTNLCGISYSLLNSSLILSVLILLAFIFNIIFHKLDGLKKFARIKNISKEFVQMPFIEKLLFATITLLVLFSTVSNLYWPIKEWDAVALYDFRANVFLRTGFMDEAVALGYFSSYPLLTSIAHTWVYLVGGASPKLIYSFFYVALIVLFYLLSKKAGLKSVPALLFTLMLSASGVIFEHSQYAYTNLPYTTYLFLGVAYSYLWIKNNSYASLIISALLIMLSTWTRFAEPFWLPIVAMVFLYSVTKRKYIGAIIYPVSVYLFRYPWRIFVKSTENYDPVSSQSATFIVNTLKTGTNIEQIVSVLKYLWSNVLINMLLLVLLLFAVIYSDLKINKAKNYAIIYLIIIILACLLVLFVGTWAFSLYQTNWYEIGNSASRMMIFLTPLILFCSALIINDNLIRHDNSKL